MFNWLRELLELRIEYRRKKLELLQDSKSNNLSLERTEHSCASCETLKMQLAIANEEKKKLLDTLLSKPSINEEVNTKVEVAKPIGSIAPVWSVRKRQLEAEDRNAAQKIAERKRIEEAELNALRRRESIDKLENEVLGESNAN